MWHKILLHSYSKLIKFMNISNPEHKLKDTIESLKKYAMKSYTLIKQPSIKNYKGTITSSITIIPVIDALKDSFPYF